MRYFVDTAERKASHSTCYYEFQMGRYSGKHWLEDSLSISDELWDECRLSELFLRALPGFDNYGPTVVTREEWAALLMLAEGSDLPWREVLEELTPWVNDCFAQNDAFTVCGL